MHHNHQDRTGDEIIMWSINTKENRSPTNRADSWSPDEHKQYLVGGEGFTNPTPPPSVPTCLGQVFYFVIMQL